MELVITLACIVLGLLILLARAQLSCRMWLGVLVGAIVVLAWAGMSLLMVILLSLLVLGGWLVLGREALRRRWLSRPLFVRIRQMLPPMSETERQALQAGTTWWEGELFRGSPDWRKLHEVPAPVLRDDERAFLEGPVEELCAMLDDWKISDELRDLPDEVWNYLKQHRFFGLIIPKRYGGLEFSAHAHSLVLQRIASRSAAAAVTVMVPNSLGPAELLLAYGTEQQKNHYLPRLASGEEIPCFALTSPVAGSDAGGITDYGIVCEREFEGERTLGLLLNWEKRYITLGPVATVLGLAFKVFDPDHLLGEREELGITCALIPTSTPGVTIGRRHDPLNIAFLNGPNSGHDVFIPMDWIIGGQDMIGHGWRMLVERLSVGRGISLPSLSVAAGKHAALTCGLYARIRKQFHQPIGRFEGVQEALARIGGMTYMMDAAERLTTSALDQGERPAVVTAMVKRYLTESMRQVVNDAMDVHGGRGICMGPSNYLGRLYQSLPVAITVEGANILTRSFMIFGQGSVRCHPYLLEEMEAVSLPDEAAGLERFDRALLGHLAYTTRNAARSFVYALSAAWLSPAPADAGRGVYYYRQLARFSACLAILADLALLSLGGALKRKEFLAGRFADVMASLYMASSSLKRYRDEGMPDADWPLVRWSCEYALYEAQQALDGILNNFQGRPLAWIGRLLVFPLGRPFRPPSDQLTHEVAQLLLEHGDAWERLISGVFRCREPEDIVGRLEHALEMTLKAEPIERRLKEQGLRFRGDCSYQRWIADLGEQGFLDESEVQLLGQAYRAMRRAIDVDDFAPDAFIRKPSGKSSSG